MDGGGSTYGYTVDGPHEDGQVGEADGGEEGAEFRVAGVVQLRAKGGAVRAQTMGVLGGDEAEDDW